MFFFGLRPEVCCENEKSMRGHKKTNKVSNYLLLANNWIGSHASLVPFAHPGADTHPSYLLFCLVLYV